MEQHEDPVAHAGQKTAQLLAAAMVGAEALAQLAQQRTQQRAQDDERAARRARARTDPDDATDNLLSDPCGGACSVQRATTGGPCLEHGRGWPERPVPDAVALDPERLQEWSDQQANGVVVDCYPHEQIITGEAVAVAVAATDEAAHVVTALPASTLHQ